MVRNMVMSWLMALGMATAGEPQALFNGKNFDGWTFDSSDPALKPDAAWSVVDGILMCKGHPQGVIRTVKDYSNYELLLEWRWAPDNQPGNSGLLIHASQPRHISIWPKSLEVQLAHENAGDFWALGESLAVANRQPQGQRWLKNGAQNENPPGEWNTARIRCHGKTLTVWINGKLMNEGMDLSTDKGAICLQSEQSPIHFRKVQLTAIE